MSRLRVCSFEHSVRMFAPQVLYDQGRPALMERLKQIAPSARPLERHKILEAIEVAVREGGLTAAGDLPIDYLCAASRMHASIHHALLGDEEEGGGVTGNAADGGVVAEAAAGSTQGAGPKDSVTEWAASNFSGDACVELEAGACGAGGAAGTASSWHNALFDHLEPKRPRRDGREVLCRRGAIGPEGCAALCAAVDAERSFLRDSVDHHAEHQLNCSKERLVELIGADEARQLFRLPDTLRETRRESRRCRRATAAAQARGEDKTEKADDGYTDSSEDEDEARASELAPRNSHSPPHSLRAACLM